MPSKVRWSDATKGHADVLKLFGHPDAACAGMDARRFDPASSYFARDIATGVCGRCPIRGACLAAVMQLPTAQDPGDFRGGTDLRLRMQMRRDLTKVIATERRASHV